MAKARQRLQRKTPVWFGVNSGILQIDARLEEVVNLARRFALSR